MKIYIATPVNARKEATLIEKQRAALERVNVLKERVKELHPNAEVWSSVGNIVIARKGLEECEARIMGACVEMVMRSDVILMDRGWRQSKGCNVEHYVAQTYGVEIWEVDQFGEIGML